MTLRIKLIAAFGTTLILSILVFGLITYLTFAHDKISDQEEIFRLRAEADLTFIHSTIERALFESLPSRDTLTWFSWAEGLTEDPIKSGNSSETETHLLKLLQTSTWMEGSATTDSLNEYQVKARALNIATNGPTFFRDKDQLYLLWPWGKLGMPTHLYVFSCKKVDLENLIAQRAGADRRMLSVWLDGEVFQTVNRLENQSLESFSEVTDFINQAAPETGRLLNGGDNYLFVPTQSLMGLQLRYLVPKSEFQSSTIAFKNRIVTALIVLGWASIWIVLIIAYRITKPLAVLDQATKDIIAFNYETPLTLNEGGKEVKSLAASFETMRKKIKELVIHDPLTELYNRRYLMHALDLAVVWAERNEEPLACIMLDLDHFKSVNDNYGHQAGDEVLRDIGSLMQACTRESDIAARYGGEEFTLLLPKTDMKTAQQVTERLRQQIERYPFRFGDQEIACTISMGIACYQEGKDTAGSLVGRADQALYLAKQQGRNRIISQ